MKQFIATVSALAVTAVVICLGLLVSTSIFSSQLSSNAGALVVCLIALVAGTQTYRRLTA